MTLICWQLFNLKELVLNYITNYSIMPGEKWFYMAVKDGTKGGTMNLRARQRLGLSHSYSTIYVSQGTVFLALSKRNTTFGDSVRQGITRSYNIRTSPQLTKQRRGYDSWCASWAAWDPCKCEVVLKTLFISRFRARGAKIIKARQGRFDALRWWWGSWMAADPRVIHAPSRLRRGNGCITV